MKRSLENITGFGGGAIVESVARTVSRLTPYRICMYVYHLCTVSNLTCFSTVYLSFTSLYDYCGISAIYLLYIATASLPCFPTNPSPNC